MPVIQDKTGQAGPIKRSKKTVRFNPQLQYQTPPSSPLHFPDIATLTDIDICNLVLSAISEKKKNPLKYLQLIDLLKRQTPNLADLLLWIKSLSSIVSSLNPSAHLLVEIILKIDWTSERITDHFFDSYRHLLENLVSAHAFYVVPISRMLISHLCYDATKPNNEIIYSRVHSILNKILTLIPSGPTFLLPILTEYFPHKSQDAPSHTQYLNNIFKVMEYAPMIQVGVLTLATDRLLQIDVEIQVEMDDISGQEFQIPSTTNTFTENSADDSEDEDDQEDDRSLVSINVSQMIVKLDSMMKIFFQYIDSLTTSLPQLFDILIEIFERVILPTHNTRFVQFIWFYICSLDPAYTDTFLGLLITKTFDKNLPTTLRCSATTYLASFVARAKYVDSRVVEDCLTLLGDWASDFVDSHEPEDGGSIKKHALFYTITQSILYIVCFRWRDDSVLDNLTTTLKPLSKIISSPFQPLKVGCVRSVIEEAAKVMHKLEMIYLYSFMQRTGDENVVASEFFPFDPFGLNKCGDWVKGIYNVYESVATVEEVDDEVEVNHEESLVEDEE